MRRVSTESKLHWAAVSLLFVSPAANPARLAEDHRAGKSAAIAAKCVERRCDTIPESWRCLYLFLAPKEDLGAIVPDNRCTDLSIGGSACRRCCNSATTLLAPLWPQRDGTSCLSRRLSSDPSCEGCRCLTPNASSACISLARLYHVSLLCTRYADYQTPSTASPSFRRGTGRQRTLAEEPELGLRPDGVWVEVVVPRSSFCLFPPLVDASGYMSRSPPPSPIGR